jgi:hypothetical protein
VLSDEGKGLQLYMNDIYRRHGRCHIRSLGSIDCVPKFLRSVKSGFCVPLSHLREYCLDPPCNLYGVNQYHFHIARSLCAK